MGKINQFYFKIFAVLTVLLCLFLLFSGFLFEASVNYKKYSFARLMLTIRPDFKYRKCFGTSFSNVFEFAIVNDNLPLLKALENFDFKFNEPFPLGTSFLEIYASGDKYIALDYLLSKDLIRKNANLPMSYSEYLNVLLSMTKTPEKPKHLPDFTSARVLIKYGADVFYWGKNKSRILPIILEVPEYIEDSYLKFGSKSLTNLKELLKNKNSDIQEFLKSKNAPRLIDELKYLLSIVKVEDKELLNQTIELVESGPIPSSEWIYPEIPEMDMIRKLSEEAEKARE